MKKYIILIIAAALSFSTSSFVYAFGGCEENCLKCHNLTVKDAERVMQQVLPGAAVDEVRMAPAKGIWEIAVTAGGKKGIAYIDFSLENLIIGNIVQIKSKANLTQERRMEITKIDASLVDRSNTLLLGETEAKHKVIVFDDPD